MSGTVRRWQRFADALVDALLEHDPDTRARLARLEGHVYALELRGTPITVCLRPQGGRIAVTSGTDRPADVHIAGTPLALVTMLRQRPEEAAAPGGGVSVQGDLHAARALQSLAAGVRIDWEEIAARYLGDVAAHQLGRAARGLAHWLHETRTALAADAADYLLYESRLLARSDEVGRFLDQVDDLRDAVERAEARVRRLEAQLGSGGERSAGR